MTIKKKETNQWDSQFDMYFRVGVLYLERAHMHKLGLVAKKHRFAGSPFEAPALHFFGPPEDMSMEEHLVLCFEDVKTQKNFYACLVTTGIFHKKGETYRGQQKNDFKELLGGGFDLKFPECFGPAWPRDTDDVIFYDQNFGTDHFRELFVRDMMVRHSRWRKSIDIITFCSKRRDRRTKLKEMLKGSFGASLQAVCSFTPLRRFCWRLMGPERKRERAEGEAVVKARRRANAVAAAALLVARGRVFEAVKAAARDPAAAAFAEAAEEPAPDAAPDANQPPVPAPTAPPGQVLPFAPTTAASPERPPGLPGPYVQPAAQQQTPATEPGRLRQDASPSPRAGQNRGAAQREKLRLRDANQPRAARPRRRPAGGAPGRALQPSPDTSPSPATEAPVDDADGVAELQRMLATAEARAADEKKRADGFGAQLADAETRWKAGDERAKAAEEERDRLKVHAEALAADFAAANAFVETANARIRAAEQDRDRQKARADAAEARAAAAEKPTTVSSDERIRALEDRLAKQASRHERDKEALHAAWDAAEARVRELEEKLKLRADRSRGDDTE